MNDSVTLNLKINKQMSIKFTYLGINKKYVFRKIYNNSKKKTKASRIQSNKI